jgi:hypothetical protein
MTKRKQIPKRVRFEVFKRDSFCCQYCGESAPSVVLHVDHIKPVSKGGTNDLINLVTSCQGCNSGKSNIELSDNSALEKQKEHLKALGEKQDQVEMMISWRESLMSLDDDLTDSVISIVDDWVGESRTSDYFRSEIKKTIKKHGYPSACDCVDNALDGFSFPMVEDDSQLSDFLKKVLKNTKYIGKSKDTAKSSIGYIRGILKNRGVAFGDAKFYTRFEEARLSMSELEKVKDIAKKSDNITQFYCDVFGGFNG